LNEDEKENTKRKIKMMEEDLRHLQTFGDDEIEFPQDFPENRECFSTFYKTKVELSNNSNNRSKSVGRHVKSILGNKYSIEKGTDVSFDNSSTRYGQSMIETTIGKTSFLQSRIDLMNKSSIDFDQASHISHKSNLRKYDSLDNYSSLDNLIK